MGSINFKPVHVTTVGRRWQRGHSQVATSLQRTAVATNIFYWYYKLREVLSAWNSLLIRIVLIVIQTKGVPDLE